MGGDDGRVFEEIGSYLQVSLGRMCGRSCLDGMFVWSCVRGWGRPIQRFGARGDVGKGRTGYVVMNFEVARCCLIHVS